MSDDHEYIVDQLFPHHQISLISGPSGAGKTTLALQLLDDWLSTGEVWGHLARVLPVCYVACDRTLRSLRRHMRRMDIDPANVPHCSLAGLKRREERNIDSAVSEALATAPTARVLFLDGLSTLCPGKVTDLRDVADFLLTTLALCTTRDLTIIGCVLSVKSREGEGYVAPQDRIMGSGAWSALTDTKIFIEPTQPRKPEDPGRVVKAVTAYGVDTHYYAFEGCRLQSRGAEIVQPDLDQWLLALPPSTALSLEDILTRATLFNVGRTRAYEWISTQVDLGTLVRVGRGQYTTPSPTSSGTAQDPS